MNQRKELQARVAAKASESADFRARLRSDPKAAIEQDLGVALPASLTVEVHEDSATTAHLILPPAAELSESELQAVAAGSDFARIDTWPPPPAPAPAPDSWIDGIATPG